jgi:hypothetical protein
VDDDVVPGGGYEYLVEYSSGDGWQTLFESGIVAVPQASLALLPNYPNPFNPSTSITYSVSERARLTLQIFDTSGKLIRTIVSEEQEPGRYTVHWNGLNDLGRRAASGTYFCRLTSGKHAESRKIILTR